MNPPATRPGSTATGRVDREARTVAHNAGRAALLEATIDAMRTAGPAKIHPNEICRELGLSKSLVNFHFGGRDGLLAEALTIAYERYVDDLSVAAEAAGASAVDRLLAWTDRQIAWTIENPGIACGLDFPEQGSAIESDLPAELRERMTAAGEANLRTLLSLVIAARIEVHADEPDFADDPEFAAQTASLIGWLTMGESIWLAGRHLPSNDSERVRGFVPGAMAAARDVIVVLLKRRPTR